MGQVFMWDAIYEKRVPELESFQHVAKIARERFAPEPSIASALLFGSVVRGDFNIRSDLDCAVIYKTSEELVAMKAMHEVDAAAHKLHVPIRFATCDTALASIRFHHFGTSFVEHLQAAINAGGLIKGDLVTLLAPTVPAWEEIEWYIKMKMYKLQVAFAQSATFSEEELVRFLKKVLEAPIHVARRMLIYEGLLLGDSKREVQAAYLGHMPDLAVRLNYLVGLDVGYSLELVHQLENPDLPQYADTLVALLSEVPRVLEFLRANLFRLSAARH